MDTHAAAAAGAVPLPSSVDENLHRELQLEAAGKLQLEVDVSAGGDVETAASASASAMTGKNANGFTTPPVIIGCWQLLERERAPEAAVQTLRAYRDAGFTAYDT